MTEAPESAELTGRRWKFGAAALDERSLELQVDGEPVPLERKPLEVLLYLLHHAGEVVTKDDLAENLWPGRVLTETVLTRCISVLRQALKDNDRALVRTVHGFGYRLVADVRVEVSEPTTAAPALDFRPGDHPPARPQWKLVERLGTGGHGEAWLARHEKTGDARVFKFALDTASLSSLKREITLYRLLHDSLGARVAIARIYEWNLAEPPYFIEMEYVAGGNLQAWTEAQGGLAGMPRSARIDLAAQIAEALAAAHSVGALHKDLKPGNVLVQPGPSGPSIRLSDFGSGSVLDPHRLESLGITRLGFTKTFATDSVSGTPLYLAPEVIAGQPFTVQADVYALGVLLYQIVTGDLRKPLAPGWEADVDDELLREDIAAAAAGNPARRLTDAAQLAERLRTLEQRRQTHAVEAAARLRAERVRRIQQELRRTRVFAVLLCALTAVAVAGGIVAYRARNEAVAATATATAISGFLMEDVLRIDSGLFRPSEASYEALLNRAAAEVGTRLKRQPVASAKIHSLLGRRYQEIGQFEVAMGQYEQAVALFTEQYGESAEPTLMALDRLAWIYLENGRLAEARAISLRIRTLWESQLPPADLAMLMVRVRIARTILAAGDYAAAESELRAIIHQTATADPSNKRVTGLIRQWLGTNPASGTAQDLVLAYSNLLLAGSVLEEIGEELDEAEARLRDSLSIFSRVLGDETELSALTNFNLAVVLSAKGETEEAEEHASRLRQYFDKTFPARHYARGLSRIAMGRVRLEQRRFPEAIVLFQQAVDMCADGSGCPPRVRSEFLADLGMALNEQGLGRAAVTALRLSLELQDRIPRPNHAISMLSRVGLADALRQSGSFDEASAVLASIGKESINALRPYQGAKAHLRRAEGLLFSQHGEHEKAVSALQASLEIVDRRLGAAHWRTERARAELAAAIRSAGN